MIIYTDGFCFDKNPSPSGGGYTIVVSDGENAVRLVCQEVIQPGMTNNDAELLAIKSATDIAQPTDTIISDSECAIAWVRRGSCKARPDLSKRAGQAKRNIEEKELELRYEPRGNNLAGIYNEAVIKTTHDRTIKKQRFIERKNRRFRFRKNKPTPLLKDLFSIEMLSERYEPQD